MDVYVCTYIKLRKGRYGEVGISSGQRHIYITIRMETAFVYR